MPNAHRIDICREENCRDAATTEEYCRYHYLKNWQKVRKIKNKELEIIVRKGIKKLAAIREDDPFTSYELEDILANSNFEEFLHDAIQKHSSSGEDDDIDIDSIIKKMKMDE